MIVKFVSAETQMQYGVEIITEGGSDPESLRGPIGVLEGREGGRGPSASFHLNQLKLSPHCCRRAPPLFCVWYI